MYRPTSNPPVNEYSPAVLKRAEEHFGQTQHASNVFTDRMFAALMVAQWIGGIVAALWLSPRTWAGAQSWVHPHVLWAAGMGALLASMPILLAVIRPGSLTTRLVIAGAQTGFSALLIHLTGGRIETHFHVFGSLAFLAFYRDVRVLGLATLVVAGDHFVRGIWFPSSVFGIAVTSPYRWIEHAGWVVFEDLFLFLSIHRSLKEGQLASLRHAVVELSHQRVEQEVQARTAQLVAAHNKATDALRIKDLFLSKMNHELRTPLTAVVGFAGLLEDATLTEQQRTEHARAVRRNGERLLELVESILDSAAISSGTIRIERAATRPIDLVNEAVAASATEARERGIEFTVKGLGAANKEIQTDPHRLRQIVGHLASNAVKFTERGSVTVTVAAGGGGGERRRLFVEFTDTGIGITPEQQRTLFQTFVQGDDSMSRRFGGAGVGLVLARELARLLGGDITVKSTAGEGSTFTLVIDGGEIEQAPAAPAAPAPASAAGLNILYVEDGPDNQRLIKFVLERAGAKVEIAENGLVGVNAVARAENDGQPHDLILMDMQMPELDGYAATKRLRERGVTRPIVALTAHADVGDRERCLAAGCSEYLTKPASKDTLLTTITRWTRGAGKKAA
jgi:signal transduction histidine kinase/ActR/RegA family two-component response regulator